MQRSGNLDRLKDPKQRSHPQWQPKGSFLAAGEVGMWKSAVSISKVCGKSIFPELLSVARRESVSRFQVSHLKPKKCTSHEPDQELTKMKIFPRKYKIPAMTVFALLVLLTTHASLAQQRYANPSPAPKKYKQIYFTPKQPSATPEFRRMIHNQATSGQTIPLWSYSTVAQDGKTYPGSMVGRSPFAHGHRVTTIPTILIPVAIQMQDTGEVFDPTVSNQCSPDGTSSVMSLILNSPLIGTPNFTLNGVNVGVAQYLDAFQRASFWAKVGGTPYHTTFSTSPTVLPVVQVSVPAANGVTMAGICSDFGMIDQGWWDNELQTVIIPQLASEGVTPAVFPQFIFDSVSQYLNGDPNQCCALGYHNAYLNGGVFQSYSSNEFDNSGAFGGDTSTMSHEIAEWMDDPAINNATPAWGAEGQVTAGNCQSNLEVGDPMSPGYPTPANHPIFETNTSTGVTYTLQELAFYSWFLGSSPSLGAGGKYSDNGTFTGYAKACPPGGTN
jgi:hypothetical protein